MSKDNKNSKDFSRRKFIGTIAAVAGAGVAGAAIGVNIESAHGESIGVDKLSNKIIPFYGKNQSGILNDAPASAIVCSFDIVTTGKQSLQDIFKILSLEIEALTQGKNIEEVDRKYPPIDNLVNGESPDVDELTITLGVGASIFDDRFGISEKKPKELIEMQNFPNDRLDKKRINGDLVIQICAQHSETCLRALRIVMRKTRNSLVLKWLEQGFVQPNTLESGKTSTRNLLGFKDGTSNPNPKDSKTMNNLVWVDDSSDEPTWAAGGSYMAVRSIRMFVEHWDRTSLDEQEVIMGRHKHTGAPIGKKMKMIYQYFTRIHIVIKFQLMRIYVLLILGQKKQRKI